MHETDDLIKNCVENKISFAEVELFDARLDLLTDYKSLRDYHNYAISMQKTVSEMQHQLENIHKSAFWKMCGIFRILKRKFKSSATTPSCCNVKKISFDKNKKQVLFIDLHVPTPDKDAGSRSVFQYLVTLKSMGMDIKYISDDFVYYPKYTEDLINEGIDVLYDDYYANNWQEFIAKNAHNFDCFFINRPLCASKYMDFIQKHTNKKVIYIACDLHFLREMREYELHPSEEKLEQAKRIKLKEFVVMNKANCTIVYNHEEKDIIKKEFGLDNVVVSPLYCIDNFSTKRKSQTKDVLFVGGFSHTPNIDGALWFYNEIWKNIDSAKLIIVGANPPEEIKSLADENVEVTGYVSDEKLLEYYANCKVCVIPLRFGAGIKGKTVEAMVHSIPIVSTSIGLEGITNTGLIPADTKEDFIKQLKEKYHSNSPVSYEKCLKENFSREKLTGVLKNIISME